MRDIDAMDYSEFVALVGERNRPSGGIKTVHSVAVNAFVNSSKKVLEIGSNTGFSSVNLSLITGCKVVGVDMNNVSVEKAKEYAVKNSVHDRVSFAVADAQHLPFKNQSFDVVWCSNVTSFISDKESAILEYLRVLKTGGILVVVPIYYRERPSKLLVKMVSEAIGTELTVRSKNEWKELFEKVAESAVSTLELLYEEDCVYTDVKNAIDPFVSLLVKRLQIDRAKKKKIEERAKYFYTLFNRNLQSAGYSILLYQKRKEKDEMELFLTKKI